jgi:4-hydroxy-tetrahydrodipicolinate synthase
MRGVYTIPVTPFTASGEVDETSLRRTIDFCCDAGAHGIVTPVNASEYTSLTDDERKHITRIACEQTRGRVPVVIGISGVSNEAVVMFARAAKDAGADAVIAMPPYVRKANNDGVYSYYKAISDAVDLPIFIQNYNPPVGTALSGAFMARLCKEIEHVEYIKEETVPAGQVISETLAAAGDACKGIMGGMAGRYLIVEYDRGACGTMPACEMTDVHVQLWDALESGDRGEARAIFNRLLPLLNYENGYGAAVYKEVLYRRGVIADPRMRAVDARKLDRFDMKELDDILADVGQLFRVK